MVERVERIDVRALAREIEVGLRGRADPERQEVTRGYFPSALEILGVSAGDLREVIRDFRDRWRPLAPESVIELARALHHGGIHEVRQAGYEILEMRKDARALLDRKTLEALGAGNDNWASVDTFATRVAGPAWRRRQVGDAVLREWAASDDRWWRRTAVVCTVALNTRARGGSGDTARTLDLCARLTAADDPMVAKGVSWALRSLVWHDPEAVRDFIDAHENELPALVKREVRTKLETGRKNR